MSVACPHCGRGGPRTGSACTHCGQAWGTGPSQWRTTAERVGLPPAAVDTAEQPIVRPKAGSAAAGGGRWIWLATALAIGATAALLFGVWRHLDTPSRSQTATEENASPAIEPESASAKQDPTVLKAEVPAHAAPAPAAPNSAAATPSAPPSPPVDEAEWPERFTEKALWLAFEAALAQGSVRGALEAVHCTPRPCVVFGRLTHGVDALRLLDAPSLAPYADDRRFIYRWTERATDMGGESHLAPHFALAFIPKDLDATTRADLERSVTQRTNLRQAAAREAPAPEAPPPAAPASEASPAPR